MHTDQHGLRVTASSRTAVDHYDRAVNELLHFRETVVAESDAALAEDPNCPMAIALRGYLDLLAMDAEQAATARARLRAAQDRLATMHPLPREQAHLSAVTALARGDLYGAAETLRGLSVAQPRDALALAVGHQLDFFVGDSTTLRDRIGSALPAWRPADQHYANVLGMYAFGLEESGDYARAEAVGVEAVERDPKDVWGIHAVAHTYEMQGRFGDGVRYFDSRLDHWSTGNFFLVHNWWHYCLYAIEAGANDRALQIYDSVLHHADSPGSVMELLDAAALLWRLYLDDVDQSARWTALARAWEPKMQEPYYAFNDMHAVMAYVGAGQFGAADKLIASRLEWVRADHPGSSNHTMTVQIGIPVCQALVAFGRRRYDEVLDLLYPIRHRINEFGGSHAQRDAVYRTLLEAALRAPRADMATELVDERITVRPCSPYNWLKQGQLATVLGDRAGAAAARQHAGELVAAAGVALR